jgi:hypothetical protein
MSSELLFDLAFTNEKLTSSALAVRKADKFDT